MTESESDSDASIHEVDPSEDLNSTDLGIEHVSDPPLSRLDDTITFERADDGEPPVDDIDDLVHRPGMATPSTVSFDEASEGDDLISMASNTESQWSDAGWASAADGPGGEGSQLLDEGALRRHDEMTSRL